jgi:ATP-binding cassette subfamily B protein
MILKDGEIAQYGTHTELVNKAGYYKELYEEQRLEESKV